MKSKRLLLVDDDGLVLATMSRELGEAGYRVCIADTGEEGLRQINLGPRPDLAILDIRMPGMSGIELARRLKPLGIPCIFLSAYDDDTYVKQAVTEGALGYLVKPIDVAKAIPTIETALQRAEEIQLLRDTEKRLDGALETGNTVNVVVGMLMERYRMDQAAAFELIQHKARSERRKVKDMAEEIMSAWHGFNRLTSDNGPRD